MGTPATQAIIKAQVAVRSEAVRHASGWCFVWEYSVLHRYVDFELLRGIALLTDDEPLHSPSRSLTIGGVDRDVARLVGEISI